MRRSFTDNFEVCLTRVAEREPTVRAFAWIDPERVRRTAARDIHGPLTGVLIGIKDVIDTSGIPTENGSALFRGRVPERSAKIVDRLNRAGAVMLGKTVTAEMAYLAPGPTRNPWNIQ